jgi:hypothetical protein
MFKFGVLYIHSDSVRLGKIETDQESKGLVVEALGLLSTSVIKGREFIKFPSYLSVSLVLQDFMS